MKVLDRAVAVGRECDGVGENPTTMMDQTRPIPLVSARIPEIHESCSAALAIVAPHPRNDHGLTKMVEGGIPFYMASDQAGNVGRAYGVWDRRQGVELRGRFIIDPDGVVQAMEVLTPPVGRRLAETIRQIQAFQHVRATKGAEATPAGWQAGEPTLKPGPDLVGNVWKVWQPKMEK